MSVTFERAATKGCGCEDELALVRDKAGSKGPLLLLGFHKGGRTGQWASENLENSNTQPSSLEAGAYSMVTHLTNAGLPHARSFIRWKSRRMGRQGRALSTLRQVLQTRASVLALQVKFTFQLQSNLGRVPFFSILSALFRIASLLTATRWLGGRHLRFGGKNPMMTPREPSSRTSMVACASIAAPSKTEG